MAGSNLNLRKSKLDGRLFSVVAKAKIGRKILRGDTVVIDIKKKPMNGCLVLITRPRGFCGSFVRLQPWRGEKTHVQGVAVRVERDLL